MGICSTLRGAEEDDVIKDRGTRKAVVKFLSSDLHFQVGDPKNKGRMRLVNEILEKVIKKLG